MPSATKLVEGGGDLVADDELRLGGQRPGDADALFLAARQLRGEAVDIIVGLQLDQRQEVLDPASSALPLRPRYICAGRPMSSRIFSFGFSAVSAIW
jgi:hypothetical protein